MTLTPEERAREIAEKIADDLQRRHKGILVNRRVLKAIITAALNAVIEREREDAVEPHEVASIRAAVEQEIAAWLRDEADPSCSGGQTLLAYADAIASGKYREFLRALAQEGQS